MQIWTIRTRFEAFKCKFNYSNGIRSIQMEIRAIWKGFEAFEWKSEPLERNSKHLNTNSNISNEIRSILMQILTIWMGFKVFE